MQTEAKVGLGVFAYAGSINGRSSSAVFRNGKEKLVIREVVHETARGRKVWGVYNGSEVPEGFIKWDSSRREYVYHQEEWRVMSAWMMGEIGGFIKKQ